MPFALEAAILSRTRSAVTSRSNCAKESSTFNVSLPIEEVVLKAWVTETKETPAASKMATMRAKSASARVKPIDLVDDHDIDPAGLHIGEQLAKGGAVHRAAGEAAVVVRAGQDGPALVLLAQDVGFAGLALRVERVERLLQPLVAGDAGIDRAAHPSGGARCHGASRSRRPKNAGPLRRVPVISRAMDESEPQLRPPQR